MKLAKTAKEIEEIAKGLANSDAMAIDTEFIRERTLYPQLALIQVATREQTWLIDPLELHPDDLEPLLKVLRDPKVLKLMHAAFADQEVLYWEYDCIAEPVLDTAVAAALSGFGDQRGLDSLLREALGVSIKKGRARARWLDRPLSKELLEYAASDVDHLVKLGDLLMDKLGKEGLAWAMEESNVNPKDFDPTPEEITQKMSKAGFTDGRIEPVLLELVRWREEKAHRNNIPRNWVTSNETLLALAKSRPKNEGQLKTFRGLKPGEIKASGRQIVQAIQLGLDQPPGKVRSKELRKFSDKEKRILDFVTTFIAYTAEKNGIAARFLLNAKRAERVLEYYEHPDISWIEEGILSENADRMVGEDLRRLLCGEIGLYIDEKELKAKSL